MSIGADGNSIEFVPPPPSLVAQGQLFGVSTINSVAYPPPYVVNFVNAQQIYVDPDGSDTVGTGSSQFPYETIERALEARTLLSNAVEVSIILASGSYPGGFTLTRNTYLVGVQTGEARQPCNINGNITLSDTAGFIGLSGLQINGTVNITGAGGNYALFACNITSGNNSAVIASAGSIFITECRLANVSDINPTLTSSAIISMRDCTVTQGGISNCIQAIASITIRQCFITSTSILDTVLPLIRFNNTSPMTSDISYSSLVYTSNRLSVTGTKTCIAYQNSGAGIQTTLLFNCLLQCDGASAPFGGPILCLQAQNSGSDIRMSYGQLSAGSQAFRLPTIGVIYTAYVTPVV
jgi:hypothetical protein